MNRDACDDHFGYCPECKDGSDIGFNVWHDAWDGARDSKGTNYVGCSRCKTYWSVGWNLITQDVFSVASAEWKYGHWRRVEPFYPPEVLARAAAALEELEVEDVGDFWF